MDLRTTDGAGRAGGSSGLLRGCNTLVNDVWALFAGFYACRTAACHGMKGFLHGQQQSRGAGDDGKRGGSSRSLGCALIPAFFPPKQNKHNEFR